MHTYLRIITTATFILLLTCESISACPMCRVALEDAMQSDQRPTAYMVSILFMLSMPFMIFGAIGGVLFYINKQEQVFADELTAEAMK